MFILYIYLCILRKGGRGGGGGMKTYKYVVALTCSVFVYY